MIEPDPSLTQRKPDAKHPAAAQALDGLPPVDALPIRVGVGVVGAAIVLSLMLAARSINRRPQHANR